MGAATTAFDNIADKIVDCSALRCVRVLMTNPFEDEKGDFVVLINEEGQYSLWPNHLDIPLGWEATGPKGDRKVCLEWIDENSICVLRVLHVRWKKMLACAKPRVRAREFCPCRTIPALCVQIQAVLMRLNRPAGKFAGRPCGQSKRAFIPKPPTAARRKTGPQPELLHALKSA
jgi:MbtH protein